MSNQIPPPKVYTKIEMFSEARIALMKEVTNHPKLIKQLANHESKEWIEQVAVIAGYCNMLMDGLYLPSQLEDIARDLIWRLKKHSTIIIT